MMPSIIQLLSYIFWKVFCLMLWKKHVEIALVAEVWEIAVHLAVACGVYGDVFLCCPFSLEVSWMRS